MNFSDEPLVNKHTPDFSVKGRFLLKFLYKAHYSSVFCTAKYRGGVRRTEGLKNSDNNKPGITLLPLPCPIALQGVAKPYRARGLKREGVEKEIKSTGKIPAFIGR